MTIIKGKKTGGYFARIERRSVLKNESAVFLTSKRLKIAGVWRGRGDGFGVPPSIRPSLSEADHLDTGETFVQLVQRNWTSDDLLLRIVLHANV